MKFELNSASGTEECYVIRRVNNKWISQTLKFKDIKSVNVSLETETISTISGENHEIRTWYVEIDTLEELLELKNEVCSDLVINNDSIIIYDDCLE